MTRRQTELLKMYACMVCMVGYAAIFVEWVKAPLLAFLRDFPPFWSKVLFGVPSVGLPFLFLLVALKFWSRSEAAAEVERKAKIGVRIRPEELK